MPRPNKGDTDKDPFARWNINSISMTFLVGGTEANCTWWSYEMQ